ncbi:hypothetical protein A1O3_01526 [Capronia epimyces CBS 606.96]|uniref:Major facilitator superfamily (MFS) profile domain-containing protein n=1 Tax=Capronia epimyces CBS 606.96 TaxID=1182542 RepID=W9YTI5_9EURO|nr:uncharacterized protein A1O3_01526 [Capronia epimyces CBS 606.96]EXJ92970.1 hypothetical protein A1O3_01526 [Capronia epimyces CBS 606.96]
MPQDDRINLPSTASQVSRLFPRKQAEEMDTVTKDETKTPYEVGMTPKPEGSIEVIASTELISFRHVDEALDAKMHLVNQAINQIELTPYHWKLFCLNGMGYAVDSLLPILMSIANTQVVLEYQPSYNRGGQIGLYVGLLVGALFWGISADIIGRKWAFNMSLFLASVFSIGAGAAPNYIGWASLVALGGSGAGGNLVRHDRFPGIFTGRRAMAGHLYGLMVGCWSNSSRPVRMGLYANPGWRYLYYTSGGFVLLMSIARITVIRFHDTPKYLLCKGEDEKVVTLLRNLATKYGRECDLTVESLASQGKITSTHSKKVFSLSEIGVHYRGLFSTKRLGISTLLIWFSWLLIALGYPLFYVFLPEYLASRGAEFGQTSTYITWRNYVLAQFSSVFGPVLAGYMCKVPVIGRKYTMAIGAVISMVFFFAYTAVRNNAENVGFNCATSFAINIYYGTLYAYSPEVLPTAHRATGNGTAVALNRIMGIMSAVIATYADTSTSVPFYICAALFGWMALVSVLFPYEPQTSQSV